MSSSSKTYVAEPEPAYNGSYYDSYKTEFEEKDDGNLSHLDPEAEEPVYNGKASIAGNVWTMSKTIVGAGLFSLPYTMEHSGFILTIILTIAMVLITFWTIRIMLVTGSKLKIMDYSEMVQTLFGKPGRIVYNVSAFIFAFGGCATYCVVIGDTIPTIVHGILTSKGHHSELSCAGKVFTSRRMLIFLTTLFVLFPVSCYKQFHKLNFTSLIGLASVIFTCFVVVIQGNTLPADQQGPKHGMISGAKASGIFPAIGTLAFIFVCHHNQFLLYRSLKNPSLKRHSIVKSASLTISFVFAMFIAVGGYVAFTSITQGNVINNLPLHSAISNVARAAFSIDMILTFPIELYVARDILIHSFHGGRDSNLLHYGYTSLITAAACVLAIITSNISIVVELTGGVAASVFAFILPAACTIQYARNTKEFSYRKFWPHIICVLLGFAIMIMTTYQSIRSVITGE